jgi:hypothetical protein
MPYLAFSPEACLKLYRLLRPASGAVELEISALYLLPLLILLGTDGLFCYDKV